ncbi:MAG: hypothetical protein R2771_16255 [Saprospiraceae bacterium]
MKKTILTLAFIYLFINLNGQVLTQGTIVKTGDYQITAYAKPNTDITTTFLNIQFSISISNPEQGETLPDLNIDQNYITNLSWEILTPYALNGRTYWDILGSDNGSSTTTTWTQNIDNPILSISFSNSNISNSLIQINDLTGDNGGNNYQSYWYLSVINGDCNCDPDGDITDYSEKFYGDSYYNGNNSYAETTQQIALPIEFIKFELNKIDNSTALLNWTISENHLIKKYIIERQISNKQWKPLDTIESKNNKESLNSYEYFDRNISSESIKFDAYYRIKAINSDNSFDYSDIKSINFADEYSDNLQIFPNPTNTYFNFNIEEANVDDNLEIYIFNLNGTLVYKNSTKYKKENFISLNNENQRFVDGAYRILIKNTISNKSYYNTLIISH